MKVLILGGTGFIGKAVTQAFIKKGDEVTATGTKDGERYDVVKDSQEKLDALVKGKDIIINLIALVNSHDSIASPESQKINVDFARTLLDSVQRINPKAKVIFSSSQTVYGKTDDALITEKHPVNPNTVYSQQKREAEKIYEEYAKKQGLSITVLRLANVYGPEAKTKSSVISLFIEKAKNDAEISVFGDGKELRDYLYIDDVAQAFIAATKLPKGWSLYNCGSGSYNCLGDIAGKIVNYTGQGKLIYKPFPDGYARYHGHILLVSDTFKKDARWSPQTTLEQGLQKMYNYQKKQ